MYWLENIDKYIEHYASPAIQQRGRTLFNIGSVRNIEYDTDNNTGTAEVAGGDLESVKIVSGVAQDFIVEWAYPCFNAHDLEKEIHAYLQKEGFRVNNKKEFFYITVEDAKSVIKRIGEPYKMVIDENRE